MSRDRASLGAPLRRLHAALLEHGLYPYLLFAGVVLAVWLPGGFAVGPYKMEDLALMRGHGIGGTLLDRMPTRLFRDVPVWVGLHLTPGSLAGWQWMLLLLAFARGALFHAIVRRMLPGQELFALLAGLLALFQPADSGYFYVNTSGEQFALVLSLAGCLCAVEYLRHPRLPLLAGMAAFELLAGFTYNGFLPLLVALPLGAWVLQWLREGARPSPVRLALVTAMPSALLALSLVFIHQKLGRDSGVADFHLGGVLAGYALAAKRIALGWVTLAGGAKSAYLLPVAAMAAAGLGLGWLGRTGDGATPAGPRRLQLAVVLGLLLLAATAYLPYALSTVRYADKRQLLMAGVFAYAAAAYLLLLALGPLTRRRFIAAGLVAVTAAAVTLAGLEKRAPLLDRYLAVESLLAAVAEAVPDPASGSFILVQVDGAGQLHKMPALYSKQSALSAALRILYGDDTLEGGFNLPGKHQLAFDARGVQTRLHFGGRRHPQEQVYAGYDRLIVVHLPRRGPATVMDAAALQQATGVAKLEVPYAPERLLQAGPGRGIACTLLERKLRPRYCSGAAPVPVPAPAAATAPKAGG